MVMKVVLTKMNDRPTGSLLEASSLFSGARTLFHETYHALQFSENNTYTGQMSKAQIEQSELEQHQVMLNNPYVWNMFKLFMINAHTVHYQKIGRLPLMKIIESDKDNLRDNISGE